MDAFWGVCLIFALGGCQSLPNTSQNEASAYVADAAGEVGFVRTELYFAIGWAKGTEQEKTGIDGEAFGESGWIRFVDEVVTPLFPDGLTIFKATGQWLSDRFEKPPKLDTRVIVILHPATEEADKRIESIRAEFLELTGQQSVLRVSQAAIVSF